jgi:thiol-disulfide isomerase/thioredoxin
MVMVIYMNKINFYLLIFLAFTLAFPAVAADFYTGKEGTGYYQYAKPGLPDNLTEYTVTSEYKRPFVPADEVLYTMPAEEFQKLYTSTLNHALTERNLDTYGDYARMIHMVNVRSKEFASLQVLYAQLHPPQNSNKLQGGTTRTEINRDKVKTLETYRDKYSLIYFYSPYCTFCQKFEPTIQNFINKYGWDVERVDIFNEPELGEAFEIAVTPTVKLVTPNEDILPISNGLISLADLEDRLYRYVRYLEGITVDLDFAESM